MESMIGIVSIATGVIAHPRFGIYVPVVAGVIVSARLSWSSPL